MYYTRKNIVVAFAVLLGIFLFAGNLFANAVDERAANRERFQDAIEERRDALNGRVRGVLKDRAGGEAEVEAAVDDSFFRRILDRIRKSRDEFNQSISERRDILVKRADGEPADHSEGFFPRMAEKFKTAFLRVAQ